MTYIRCFTVCWNWSGKAWTELQPNTFFIGSQLRVKCFWWNVVGIKMFDKIWDVIFSPNKATARPLPRVRFVGMLQETYNAKQNTSVLLRLNLDTVFVTKYIMKKENIFDFIWSSNSINPQIRWKCQLLRYEEHKSHVIIQYEFSHLFGYIAVSLVYDIDMTNKMLTRIFEM